MRFSALALVLLAGCDRPSSITTPPAGGAALEQAARERGLVPKTAAASGVFQTDTDRVCLLPAEKGIVIGASVDYGEGQRCVARGRATSEGGQILKVDFGGDCRFDARLEAERLVFPAVLPEACAATCIGRASLSAITASRLSDAPAEAARTRGADGSLLCPG